MHDATNKIHLFYYNKLYIIMWYVPVMSVYRRPGDQTAQYCMTCDQGGCMECCSGQCIDMCNRWCGVGNRHQGAHQCIAWGYAVFPPWGCVLCAHPDHSCLVAHSGFMRPFFEQQWCASPRAKQKEQQCRCFFCRVLFVCVTIGCPLIPHF